MTYILVGERQIIKETIKDIINKNNILNDCISKYDLSNSLITQVIDDLNTYSFFGDKKLVIVDNINLLTKIEDEESEEKIDIYINKLIDYLNNQSDNILVLTGSSLPRKKKLTDVFNNMCTKIDLSNFDINSYIKDILEDYKMSYMDIEVLKSYCSNNVIRIKNELDKLKIYKINNKEIKREDIDLLVKKDLDKTIFDLMNSIENGDKKRSFEVYKLLKDNKEEDMKILSMLANNYRLIYRIKILSKEHNDEEIAKILDIKNIKRISVLKSKGRNFNTKELENIISSLADLDLKIKTGLMDKQLALELFIAK